MDSQKQQVAARIKEANNILVTVSANPSVDQLAACIGLTVALNKMGKHATAVFSGDIPSTIEFLQPEKTLEKNTDSLRDFIIALDKSKADKLRYKVEDRVVKIFITPYKTSINEKDLEFSQGDFNVDVVVALGVHAQTDLDQAITSHGRILHDAAVVTMNVRPGGELGTINWLEPNASSLSQLTVQLTDLLDKKLMDGQIATAFLTGIVAETERFSNAKTSPQTMSISAELMAVGANQQLVATKLEEPAPAPPLPSGPIAQQGQHAEATEVPPVPKKPDDGTLEIAHDERDKNAAGAKPTPPTGFESAMPTPPSLPEPAEENHDHDGADHSFIPTETPSGPPVPAALTPPFEPLSRTGKIEPEQPPQPPQSLQPPEGLPTSLTPPQPPAALQPPTPSADQPVSGSEPQVVAPQIHIDEHGQMSPLDEGGANQELDESLLPPANHDAPTISHHNEAPRMILEPPTMGGEMAASGVPGGGFAASGDDEDGPGLPGMPQHDMPLLGAATPTSPAPSPAALLPATEPEPQNAPGTSFLGEQPLMPSDESKKPTVPGPNETLSDIEKDVHSSHIDAPTPAMPGDNVMPSPLGAPTPAPAPTANPAPAIPVVGPNDLTQDDIAQAFGQPANEQNADQGENNDNNANTNLDQARDAVAQAIGGSPAAAFDPLQALNANPLADPNAPPSDTSAVPTDSTAVQYPATPVQPWTPPTDNAAVPQPGVAAPPSAPPPMMPNM